MGKNREKSSSDFNKSSRPQSLPPSSPASHTAIRKGAFSTPPRKSLAMPSPFSIAEPRDIRNSPTYIAQQKAKDRKAADDALRQRVSSTTSFAPGASAAEAAYARLNSQFDDTPKKVDKDKSEKKDNTPFVNKLLDVKDGPSLKKSKSRSTLDLEGLKELNAAQNTLITTSSAANDSQQKYANSSRKKKKNSGGESNNGDTEAHKKPLSTPAPASSSKATGTRPSKEGETKSVNSGHKKDKSDKKRTKAKNNEATGNSLEGMEKPAPSQGPATPANSGGSQIKEGGSRHKSSKSSHKKKKKKNKSRVVEAAAEYPKTSEIQVRGAPAKSAEIDAVEGNGGKSSESSKRNRKKKSKKSKASKNSEEATVDQAGSVSVEPAATASEEKSKSNDTDAGTKGKPDEGPKDDSMKKSKKANKEAAEAAPAEKTSLSTRSTDSDQIGASSSNKSDDEPGKVSKGKSAESSASSESSISSSESDSESDADKPKPIEKSNTAEKIVSAKAKKVNTKLELLSSSSEPDADDESEHGSASKFVKEKTKKRRKKKAASDCKSADRVATSGDESSSFPGEGTRSEPNHEPWETSKTQTSRRDSDSDVEDMTVPDHISAFMDALQDLPSGGGEEGASGKQEGTPSSASSSSSSSSESEDNEDKEENTDYKDGENEDKKSASGAEVTSNVRKRKRSESDGTSAPTSTVASRNPLPDPALFPSARASLATSSDADGGSPSNPSKKRKTSHVSTPTETKFPDPSTIRLDNPYPPTLIEQMHNLEAILDDYNYKGDKEVDMGIRLIALIDNARQTILKLAVRKVEEGEGKGAEMQSQLTRIAKDREDDVKVLRGQIWEMMEERQVRASTKGRKGR